MTSKRNSDTSVADNISFTLIMDSYNSILQQLQQTEESLLERWKKQDTYPMQEKMKKETEKMYKHYLQTLRDLCQRQDAGQLFQKR